MATAEDIKLSSFSTALTDLARSNRFIVTFSPPPEDSTIVVPSNLKYLVKSTQ